jgi:YidC/Oxa1 family membrane protein insertase
MNFKDLVVPLVGGVLSFWLINYMLEQRVVKSDQAQQYHAGQMVQAPAMEVLFKPLQTEVSFKQEEVVAAKVTTVETPYALFTFSTAGGALERYDLKRSMFGEEGLLSLIAPDEQKEQQAFLVALAEDTPYFYQLIDKSVEPGATIVSYKATTDHGTIVKTYKVYHDRYQVDLTVMFEPRESSNGMQARIIFPRPLLHDPKVDDEYKAIMYTDQNQLEKKTAKEVMQNFWVAPSLIGTENRYFIIAAVRDAQRFVQRAYFNHVDKQLFTLLEGPVVKEKTSWTLSFFMGPKEADALTAVDARLLDTLDYGFFAWLARIMMKLLNILYKYVHNYGWAIIIFTIVVRLLLMPLSLKSQTSLKKANEIQKKLQHLEQQYKNDPETLKRKREEVTMQMAMPMMLGCFIMLVQVPLLIGLTSVLRSSIELYQAPFILWIKDLSMRDPYFVLPILAGLGFMSLSSNAPGFDPRQRIGAFLMIFVFIAFMSNVSAGVVLFTATSIWMGVLEGRLVKFINIKA